MATPTNAGSISGALTTGGVSPLQAEQVANQLTNAFQRQLSRAPVQVDYTPRKDMRLIGPEARKYRFQNLDWEDNRAYRASKRASKSPEQERRLSDPDRHPLDSSQPVTVSQAINEDQVLPGKYIDVLTQRRNRFAIHTISIRLGVNKGVHPRFNQSTGAVDGVALEVDIGQNEYLKGSVRETPSATSITLSLQNLRQVRVRLPDENGSPRYQTIVCWTAGSPGP